MKRLYIYSKVNAAWWVKGLLLLATLHSSHMTAHAQERKPQNKPYIDLRPMHFGISVGFHMQDIELQNVGPQIITLDDGTQTTAQAPTTPLDLCLYKGDRYMEMLSPETPHYIDSAIYFYRRALRYDNTDTIARPRYNRAMITRNEMVTQIQRNIREDSATYFLSLRRPTEGLRLFKYKYDPRDTSKRKFGFVDTLGNVVIPPFFDLN